VRGFEDQISLLFLVHDGAEDGASVREFPPASCGPMPRLPAAIRRHTIAAQTLANGAMR
jgi:hypothetical protein